MTTDKRSHDVTPWLRWSWFSTGTVPFVGVCWFAGTVIVGLWPLTVEFGPRRAIEWSRP